MAVKLKFHCFYEEEDYLELEAHPDGGFICITGKQLFDTENIDIDIILDVPTAIKLHKTLRHEINKAKEDQNGTR